MDQKKPRASRRSGSFNPEAPTFSPTAAETSMSTGLPRLTPPTSPRSKPKMPDMFDEDSPFRPARDLRPNYQGYEEVNAGRMPRELPNQENMPLDALQQMLQEHHVDLNRDQTGAASRSNLAGAPVSNAPDVDELSAGLGLPGIKRMTDLDSPARSHKSRVSEGLSEGLYAQYLHGKDVSSDVAEPPQGRKSYIQDRYPERADGERQPTKVVPPPPGFTGERPRRIFAGERSSVSPMAMESPVRQAPTGPAGFGQPRCFSDLQSANYMQRRGPGPELSSQRDYRPRALTRTKRTDQGPEPSHADIYPDDANIMPRRPSYQPEPAGVLQGLMPAMPAERQFRAEATAVWPTPAEVYTPKPASPARRSAFARGAPSTENRAQEPWSPPPASSMSQYIQQFGESSHPFAFTFPPPAPTPSPPFDIFEDHHAPTYADIHDADAEMECLLAILPDIFDLDLPEMPCDTRPLTPGQADGTRYGLAFHGIGVGDTWTCPPAREGEPFRVRPRDHDGWGGWQWAIDRGWGNDTKG